MERMCLNKSRWDGSSTDVLCLTEATAFPNSKYEGGGGGGAGGGGERRAMAILRVCIAIITHKTCCQTSFHEIIERVVD